MDFDKKKSNLLSSKESLEKIKQRDNGKVTKRPGPFLSMKGCMQINVRFFFSYNVKTQDR